jgi:hypothetical protein
MPALWNYRAGEEKKWKFNEPADSLSVCGLTVVGKAYPFTLARRNGSRACAFMRMVAAGKAETGASIAH